VNRCETRFLPSNLSSPSWPRDMKLPLFLNIVSPPPLPGSHPFFNATRPPSLSLLVSFQPGLDRFPLIFPRNFKCEFHIVFSPPGRVLSKKELRPPRNLPPRPPTRGEGVALFPNLVQQSLIRKTSFPLYKTERACLSPEPPFSRPLSFHFLFLVFLIGVHAPALCLRVILSILLHPPFFRAYQDLDARASFSNFSSSPRSPQFCAMQRLSYGAALFLFLPAAENPDASAPQAPRNFLEL